MYISIIIANHSITQEHIDPTPAIIPPSLQQSGFVLMRKPQVSELRREPSSTEITPYCETSQTHWALMQDYPNISKFSLAGVIIFDIKMYFFLSSASKLFNYINASSPYKLFPPPSKFGLSTYCPPLQLRPSIRILHYQGEIWSNYQTGTREAFKSFPSSSDKNDEYTYSLES